VPNRVEPMIPNITLDNDQVKSSRQQTSTTNKNTKKPTEQNQTLSKTNYIFTVIIYLILIGASWFFYQENQKLHSAILLSEERIQSLENQLSATGEEMGESTVALKVKLEAITEKTEKLWAEMDKLWASAWRRNQTEIKELRSDNKKQGSLLASQTAQIKTTLTTVKGIEDKLTSTEFNINALSDQISEANKIQNKMTKLNNTITTLEEKFSGRDVQQMEVATNVNQLDMTVTLLLERLEKLEKNQQTQINERNSTPVQ